MAISMIGCDSKNPDARSSDSETTSSKDTTTFTSKERVINDGEDGSIRHIAMEDYNASGKLVRRTESQYYPGQPDLLLSVRVTEFGQDSVSTLIQYSREGNIASKETRINDQLNGVWTTYDEHGVLFQEFEMKDNMHHGSSRFYDAQGELEREEIYDMGKLIRTIEY